MYLSKHEVLIRVNDLWECLALSRCEDHSLFFCS